MIDINSLKFNNNGLIPAIIQDFNNKEVLMLGYMNKKSLKLTIESGKTWFYSRSRQKLWNKGETSGNFHEVMSIKHDCDMDCLLVEVIPNGPTCHTGNYSCFYKRVYNKDIENIEEDKIFDLLYTRIVDRKKFSKDNSYTRYLFNSGVDKILKKVGEEASEVIIAAKNDSKEEVIYEVVDLIYHLMVLLVEKDIILSDIKREMINRYR
ncbi:bifunctional phosphoribosyl-AMP cyclohydrolase/phosphoribosyl-ATP diphosphatase HisIE [Caminicella sporogenes]|uniref:bifunctional phosphoribosyl-AMP cyclohydrolase/phosphoribosyl-ATP diphosphatase HisIE n=1 Tax=Caminicella sporogenes TaxID=166485 RepID=UPI002540A64A|nr:bifunctional phosphoribosyl-AMP cyclohydrolase/phosphoribosyl-ATP diphosphatase HisIE [Caminicella sporogenes]WIF95501.1 bifunctional phosphoribosyl-AMP cyclohydrolase/phosphoribosyl-ATP diphosphatase HisIE [Caminicella sporogenes]